ncbi:hypothetical protein TNCV_1793721 [Trichonephila clavipes]|nr:hypothetical protein TNCV_1793721 [Trichonephila clavipes]
MSQIDPPNGPKLSHAILTTGAKSIKPKIGTRGEEKREAFLRTVTRIVNVACGSGKTLMGSKQRPDWLAGVT